MSRPGDFGAELATALDELLLDVATVGRWPLPDGRQPCAPCRGYDDHCAPLGCSGAVLDELLWGLFGWLWLAGGRSELETWTPDETRVAGVDDELATCADCRRPTSSVHTIYGELVCPSCAAAPRCRGCYCRLPGGYRDGGYCADCEQLWEDYYRG